LPTGVAPGMPALANTMSSFALSVARAVSDDQLSREILKTVAQLLKDPLRKGTSGTARR